MSTVAVSYEPYTLGPTWQTDDDGNWLLPERTLGWQVIEWCADYLISPDGGPWQFTLEQMRLVLWIYAIDERGRFIYRDIVLQRMKGWGKDPLGAVLALVEFIGPCRFSHWATQGDVDAAAKQGRDVQPGDPIARDERAAWVQLAAVSEDQTKNTAALFPALLSDLARQTYDVELNKEKSYAQGGTKRLEIISSSSRSIEGNRPTFIIRNETHHWIKGNGGYDPDNASLGLAGVLFRNLGKIPGGQARGMSITNAYSPSEASYGKRQREEHLANADKGRSHTLYDSLEAPTGANIVPPFTFWDEENGVGVIELGPDGEPIRPSAEVTREHLRRILTGVRGDAIWLDVDRLIDDIFSGEMSTEEAKRFYLNSITLGDDASFNPDDIRATTDPEIAERRKGWEGDPLRVGWTKVSATDEVVMFGDGSKSDDSTGLVGCRISDGYTFVIGVWERPPEGRARHWTAPRPEIDARVHEAMARFNIVAFWFDPSHTKDDEDSTRYWDALVDSWHQLWGDKLQAWAQQSGDRRSAVGWDMTSPARKVDFVQAVERFTDEMESQVFTHDGHPALVSHLINARRRMTDAGLSVSKINRSSRKKIDLAVCAIGARMLRRFLMNKGLEVPVSGKVWW